MPNAQTTAELEAILADDPNNQNNWHVYADHLLSQSHPWAAVIAAACSGKPDLASQSAAEQEWLQGIDGAEVRWAYGAVQHLLLAPEEEPEGDRTMDAVLARMLAHPAGRLVVELDLGLPPREGGDIDWNFDEVLAAIAAAGPLPLLQRVDMTRSAEHMDQDSWRRIGDVSALWAAAPNLRELAMMGASGSDGGVPLLLGEIAAPKLQRLIIQSGGLSEEAPLAIGRAVLPALQHLELWFGREDYGNTCTVESLSGILSGQGLPALETLALRNSEWETPLLDAVLNSTILPRLARLDLSMGIFHNDAVSLLLANKDRLAHLQSLDVSDNYIPEPRFEELKQALPMISLGRQRTPDVYQGEVYRYSSVGE